MSWECKQCGVYSPDHEARCYQCDTMRERRITQIAVAGDDNTPDRLYALCDDGTVWFTGGMLSANEWVQLPTVPQPELSKEGN